MLQESPRIITSRQKNHTMYNANRNIKNMNSVKRNTSMLISNKITHTCQQCDNCQHKVANKNKKPGWHTPSQVHCDSLYCNLMTTLHSVRQLKTYT